MTEDEKQPEPSGAEIVDQERTAESLSRMRAVAGLTNHADDFIYNRVTSIIQREAEEHGESQTHKLWQNSSTPDGERAWKQREREIAYELRSFTEKLQRGTPESPCQKIPESIAKGRHVSQLSEWELQQAKAAMERENDQKAARQYRRERGIPED